ncbi:hypothetical protein E4U15_002273 [Claviceps sp. LM218 group G6]|nr:hypothetical protein E4U15_002273 [Claviceps sp. LM218 group G6]
MLKNISVFIAALAAFGTVVQGQPQRTCKTGLAYCGDAVSRMGEETLLLELKSKVHDADEPLTRFLSQATPSSTNALTTMSYGIAKPEMKCTSEVAA